MLEMSLQYELNKMANYFMNIIPWSIVGKNTLPGLACGMLDAYFTCNIQAM